MIKAEELLFKKSRKERQKEASQRYYAKNRGRILARNASWRERNPDYWRKWRERNPDYFTLRSMENKEQRAEYDKWWREQNPNYMREYKRKWLRLNGGRTWKELGVVGLWGERRD